MKILKMKASFKHYPLFKGKSIVSWVILVLFFFLLAIYVQPFWHFIELFTVFLVYGIYCKRDGATEGILNGLKAFAKNRVSSTEKHSNNVL